MMPAAANMGQLKFWAVAAPLMRKPSLSEETVRSNGGNDEEDAANPLHDGLSVAEVCHRHGNFGILFAGELKEVSLVAEESGGDG